MVKTIRFVLTDSDDFLDSFALRHLWLPFEAACLIRGYEPKEIVGNSATVWIESQYSLSTTIIDEFASDDPEASRDLIDLTAAIIQKWGTKAIEAETVVEWALLKGEMTNTPFVRKVLGRVPYHEHIEETKRLRAEIEGLKQAYANDTDGKGKHHQEKRMAILGSTIQELAKLLPANKIDNLMHGENVNAAGLATHLDTFRADLKLPAETTRGFSYRNIENTLRLALSEATKHR